MTKKRNRGRKRRKRKQTGQTAHASLAGFAPLILSKGIFETIHQQVSIGQKQLTYRPTDKLIFVVLGLLVGCQPEALRRTTGYPFFTVSLTPQSSDNASKLTESRVCMSKLVGWI